MKSWKTKLKKLKVEKLKVEKRIAEFSLKFTFTFKKPILPASNSRFVSWLVQFFFETKLLNRNFVYICDVLCRKYATRQSGNTLVVSSKIYAGNSNLTSPFSFAKPFFLKIILEYFIEKKYWKRNCLKSFLKIFCQTKSEN